MCIRDRRQAERAAARAAAAAQQSSPTYSWVQGSGQLGWPVSGETVSYTHLDVYKRQDKKHSKKGAN